MDTISRKATARKDFVLHNVSANVLKSLTPQAAHLWITMRRLADARTGLLRYPDGGLITRAKILKQVGMSKNTFGKYLLELRANGLAHSQQYLIATGNRPVYSDSEYAVSENPRPEWVSCVAQSKKPHRHSGPCVTQLPKNFCVAQFLSPPKNWDSSYSQNPTSEDGPGKGVGVRLSVLLVQEPTGECVSSYQQIETFLLAPKGTTPKRRRVKVDALEAYPCPCGSIHWFTNGGPEPMCYCFQCGCEFGKPHVCGAEGIAECA